MTTPAPRCHRPCADKYIVEGQKPKLFDVLSKSSEEKSNEIMEGSLDNAWAEIATTIAGYIAKKLSKNL